MGTEFFILQMKYTISDNPDNISFNIQYKKSISASGTKTEF